MKTDDAITSKTRLYVEEQIGWLIKSLSSLKKTARELKTLSDIEDRIFKAEARIDQLEATISDMEVTSGLQR